MPDLDSDDLDLDLPAVYLSPPLFQPETASRISAFSAGRGQFQIGLISDGEEVAFPTLATLTEFVRRCYLSGGGTDGTSGRGPVPPPVGPEPDASRGLEFEFVESGDLIEFISTAAKDFALLKLKVPDFSDEFKPTLSYRSGGDMGDHAGLADAAYLLVRELWSRYPVKDDVRARAEWADAIKSLYTAIERLGLSDAVDERLYLEPPPTPSRLQLRFSSWPRVPMLQTDPLDDLSTWPLPKPLFPSRYVSVRDHLLAGMSDPSLLEKPLGAALALFAAAHILQVSHTVIEVRSYLDPIVEISGVWRAADWLIKQMPSFVYRPDLEAFIAQVGIKPEKEDDYGGSAYA